MADEDFGTRTFPDGTTLRTWLEDGEARYEIDDHEADLEDVVELIAAQTGTDITPTDPPDPQAIIAQAVADHEPGAE